MLVGLREGDTDADAEFMCACGLALGAAGARPHALNRGVAHSARKILNARLFANADTGRAWDRSVVDEAGEVLCVSQARGLSRTGTRQRRRL